MQINGVELELKLTNASFADRIEKALNDFESKAKNTPIEKGLAEIIRYQCEAVKEFFNSVFGEGTYEKLHLDPEDLDENFDAASILIDELDKQKNNVVNKFSKYSPNRAQRRAKR